MRAAESGVLPKVATAWALVIVATGLLPTQGVVHSVSGGRDGLLTSVGHFAAYAILAVLLALAASSSPPDGSRAVGSRRRLARVWLLAVSLGVVIEVVQGPLPYRDAQAWDVLVNGAGAALGGALFSAVARAREQERRWSPG